MLNDKVICVGAFSMITFKVVKEQHGWAIRMGEGTMTPFWSRDLAVRQANSLAAAIRCHGECAQVIVDGADQGDRRKMVKGLSSSRLEGPIAGALGGRPQRFQAR
jgi:hypothetical protein